MPSEPENMQKNISVKPKKLSPELSEFMHMLEALEGKPQPTESSATRSR